MKPARHAAKWPSPEPPTSVDAFGLTPEQRHRCVRAVASAAADAQDCALLLDILGLDAAEGRTGDGH